MVDLYEVMERFSIMTESGIADSEALDKVCQDYGEKWRKPIMWIIGNNKVLTKAEM